MKRLVHAAIVLAALQFCTSVCSAASFVFSGAFTSDGDVQYFFLNVTGAGTLTAQSLGYGGFASPAASPGGFATSLSLYDAGGNQVALDFVGGTATGGSCSNGAHQDPTTHACEDATISFPSLVGLYTLTLSEQGNDGPDPLNPATFPLSAGSNFPGGPFIDPGVPGNVQRNGNWALQISLTGQAVAAPEPGGLILVIFGLAAVAFAGKRQMRKSSAR